MKKNIFTAVLSALLVLSVIGCNSEKSTVEDTAEKYGNDVSSVESSELEAADEFPENVVQT